MLHLFENSYDLRDLAMGLVFVIICWTLTSWVRRCSFRRLLRAAAVAAALSPGVLIIHNGIRLAPAWAVGHYYISRGDKYALLHTATLSVLPIVVMTVVLWGIYSLCAAFRSEAPRRTPSK